MTSRTTFPKLFEPGFIGGMETRNRIVMPPMGMAYANDDGQVTDLLIDHYEQRSRGGAGLIIVQFTCVHSPFGMSVRQELLIDDDNFITGLSKLSQAIKKHGAKAAIQLAHSGREARARFTGFQPVAPSSIPSPWGEIPRKLSQDEIKKLVCRFAEAAGRAKQAGFDGVEIHSAHGYLLAQFLSPAANKRQDGYGGSVQNRTRFLIEIIRAVKAEVGYDYPVWCRLNGMEAELENGFTVAEAKIVAKMAEEAGCDAVSVSAFGVASEATITIPETPGALISLTEKIKQVVGIPVIAVGRIAPEAGEKVLTELKADFVAIGRQLICDPELPVKAMKGRMHDIVPCIHCLVCLDNLLFKYKAVTCSVNATTGRHIAPHRIEPVVKPKKVVIVGGGPAGLETARVAAIRGHEVILCETTDKLGGQMLLAALPPRKHNISDYIKYMVNQMEKLRVDVKLGNEVKVKELQSLEPDAVVIATGIIPVCPDIPGVNSQKTIFAKEVLAGIAKIGQKVIVIGGGIVGCEVADFLSENGKYVTVVEMLPRLAADMVTVHRANLLSRLKAKGVTMFVGATPRELSEGYVLLSDNQGKSQTLDADTILIAYGGKPKRDLYDSLVGKVPEVYLAGDTLKPGTIQDAVAKGFDIGIAL